MNASQCGRNGPQRFPVAILLYGWGSMFRPQLRCLSLVAPEQPPESFAANDRPVPASRQADG